MASDLPSVVERLQPGRCISNYPQEKKYINEEKNWFRVRRTYTCRYFCMNQSNEIDSVLATHTDTVWFDNEDGSEFLCIGMELKWVETPTGKHLGYFNIIDAHPFEPMTTRNKELQEWYQN